MAQPRLEVTTTVEPPVAVVHIKGELTTEGEDTLGGAFASLPAGTAGVVLDFEELDYMNSGGIGLVVTMLIRANREGRSVHAFGLDDHFRKIFKLTRLDEAIAIHDSRTAAVAAAGTR